LIEVDHLTKRYGSFTAVDDASFRVESGQVLGFLGSNGAGKTSTMRILTCFLPLSEGAARVAGFDVTTESMEVRKRIGYLPEHPPLYDDMNVKDYVDFCAQIKSVKPGDRASAVSSAIDRTGLGERRTQIIGTLSKGYRQRVGLAQALVHNPEVLVLDEPTIGLDPAQIKDVRELIKGLAGDHTVILSTHLLPEVSMTCQAVAIINDGRIRLTDTVEHLGQRHRRLEISVSGASGEAIEAQLSDLPGVRHVSMSDVGFTVDTELAEQTREALKGTAETNGWTVDELEDQPLTLEEIFLRVISEEAQVS